MKISFAATPPAGDYALVIPSAGTQRPGIAALFQLAGKDARMASARDLGFAIGPRINAAGRLTNMTIGIECLKRFSFSCPPG